MIAVRNIQIACIKPEDVGSGEMQIVVFSHGKKLLCLRATAR